VRVCVCVCVCVSQMTKETCNYNNVITYLQQEMHSASKTIVVSTTSVIRYANRSIVGIYMYDTMATPTHLSSPQPARAVWGPSVAGAAHPGRMGQTSKEPNKCKVGGL
jgi:hypothetical protein